MMHKKINLKEFFELRKGKFIIFLLLIYPVILLLQFQFTDITYTDCSAEALKINPDCGGVTEIEIGLGLNFFYSIAPSIIFSYILSCLIIFLYRRKK